MFGLFGGDEKDATDAADSAAAVDVGAEVTKIFGSFMSMAQEVGSAVKQGAETVVATGDIPLISDFQREQSKFISEKRGAASSGLPPWSGYEDEDNLREQILALSSDRRNFLRDPPAGQTAFKFEYSQESSVAMVMLQEDPNLPKMRFELVPKAMAEERFWRNYFYRVYLMKQTSNVSTMVEEADDRAPPDGMSAGSPAVAVAAPSRTPIEQLTESPENLHAGLDDDHFGEVVAAAVGGVSLAELGGEIDDEVSFGTRAPDEVATPTAAVGAIEGLDEGEVKPASATPSAGSAGDGGISSDNSWDRAEVETETDMSEFELLKDDVGDVELEDGWEDEVNAMLEEEENS
mmetsp:Transcript_28683/g.86105  ORF Transcript_28683/g.86105 Transcript_28683/m.86105 type:complete len:348 (-) Transcript_28683:514-1557(-)